MKVLSIIWDALKEILVSYNDIRRLENMMGAICLPQWEPIGARLPDDKAEVDVLIKARGVVGAGRIWLVIGSVSRKNIVLWRRPIRH